MPVDPDSLHTKPSFGSEHLNTLADAIGADNMPLVLDQILELTPQICEELAAACTEGDMQRIAHAAHKVKSNCAYLGAARLVATLTKLEALAMDKHGVGMGGAVSDIVLQLDRFLQDVRNARKRWPG